VRLPLLLAWAACGSPPPETCAGERLFGSPNANTGLGPDACGPTCTCGGEPWTPPAYTAADGADLRAWDLRAPFDPLPADPYAAPPAAPTDPGEDPVCAVVPRGPRAYVLRDYPSPRDAEREGAQVTHFGRCGVCSPLQDLAVYLEQPDLTAPVRACGLDHWADPLEDLVGCLEALGFTTPCAQIWAYNTLATRSACGAVCLAALDDPYHEPDGALNACLQCDEDASGPVFQAVAGRTRRNTGLPSSMCRPCGEVRPVEHRYRAR
jgi:hypothetical protein